MHYAVSEITKVTKKQITEDGFKVMECGGYRAALMRAPRLKGNKVFDLPPGDPIATFPISCLPGSPEGWVRDAGSYVCPVKPEWALWFDWRQNPRWTAVLTSVKGVNPVTGRKTDGFALEQYAEKCPVHEKPFGPQRHCEECGYRWPPQSYVSMPNTLWWDGWRQADGTVRQFFFTEEDEKDIASALIGKENTMPAFGFAFFDRKKRPQPPRQSIMRGAGSAIYGSNIVKSKGIISQPSADEGGWSWNKNEVTYGLPIVSHSISSGGAEAEVESVYFSNDSLSAQFLSSGVEAQGIAEVEVCGARGMSEEAPEADEGAKKRIQSLRKEVAVGAGAQIRQDLEPDPTGLSEYKDEPSSVIRLYFVFPGQFKDILKKGGFKILENNKEGFLKGLPTG